jgi:muramoyltetrapeptide carboxypeptidase
VTLLIDPPQSAGHGRLWSHLASDVSYDELHAFAAALGIPRRGFDRDHYDIPAERYHDVVAAGAVPVSSRELIRRLDAVGLRRRKRDTLRPRRPGRRLLRPRRLAPGERVAVVAPAGPAPVERLEAGLRVLRSWGLEVVEMPHVRGRLDPPGYLAAHDDERAADLLAAWCDPAVRAVVCARGGYGTHRILDLLDWDALARAGPKVLVGFSDVTALHQAFAARLGLATVHGPVVTSLGAGDATARDHLHRLLFRPAEVTALLPRPVEVLVPGLAEGVLVGGNVAVLAACVGTSTSLPADGGIAVLEDVGEATYRLDRALTHLLRAGWFEGVAAVVAGAFDRCGHPDRVRALLLDRLGGLGVPVLLGAPVGHVPGNLAVPLGVRARVDAAGDVASGGTLTLVDVPLT